MPASTGVSSIGRRSATPWCAPDVVPHRRVWCRTSVATSCLRRRPDADRLASGIAPMHAEAHARLRVLRRTAYRTSFAGRPDMRSAIFLLPVALALRSLLLLIVAAATTGSVQGQSVPTIRLGKPPRTQEPLQLVQRTRIGSLSRDEDAFGRVAYVALRRNGDIMVADDQTHRVSAFGADGKLKRQIGRQGQGPGEFELPWLIASLASDSVAVWDAALARVSVFSPALDYVRSFSVPPSWVLHSLRELPDGRLLASALDISSRKALHVLSRDGKTTFSFGDIAIPRDVTPYESSLLGGRALVLDSLIVFSHKSPFRIDVFDLRGRHLRRCEGSADATSAPQSVISRDGASASLLWRQFVHSTGFLPGIAANEVWNVITDHSNGRTTLFAVDITRCSLARERTLSVPLYLNDASSDHVVGVLESDFPEVILYRRAGRSRD